jgi:RHS repeat-associated protein
MNAPASVTVNNQATYRKVEYYRTELSINNTSAPQWQSVTNKAVQSGTTNSVTGNVFLPKTPEVFIYDADGNLLSDGRWTNSWDAENRLISMQGLSTLPIAANLLLNFEYDWQGRRIRKQVSTYNGHKYTLSTDTKAVYDAWNCVVEPNGSDVVQRRYMWGLDLSGSEQGAGGVGGLFAIQDDAGGTGVHFAAYDGNGNVAALVKASDGMISATYEYGPFGEVLRANGTMARANPFRFSTKYQDDETDLFYYGFRYYRPSTGRWINKDPLEEHGSANPYAFVCNAPTGAFDPDGRISVTTLTKPPFTTVCGSYDVSWAFALDKRAAEDGYIVQKVTYTYNYTDTEDTETHETTDFKKVYWEAWFVPAAKDGATPSVEDDGSWPGKTRSQGTARQVTEIKFFFKRTTGNLGDYRTPPARPDPSTGWEPGDGVSFSVDLPWTGNEPIWWRNPSDNSETSASRSVNTDWVCKCVNKHVSSPVSEHITVAP